MNRELNEIDKKKAYEPPRLAAISLRPEEAVLGACKITGSGGAVSMSSCTALGTPCNALGS
jgi:hypothetical protein